MSLIKKKGIFLKYIAIFLRFAASIITKYYITSKSFAQNKLNCRHVVRAIYCTVIQVHVTEITTTGLTNNNYGTTETLTTLQQQKIN
jgi:hypothetical protein